MLLHNPARTKHSMHPKHVRLLFKNKEIESVQGIEVSGADISPIAESETGTSVLEYNMEFLKVP